MAMKVIHKASLIICLCLLAIVLFLFSWVNFAKVRSFMPNELNTYAKKQTPLRFLSLDSNNTNEVFFPEKANKPIYKSTSPNGITTYSDIKTTGATIHQNAKKSTYMSFSDSSKDDSSVNSNSSDNNKTNAVLDPINNINKEVADKVAIMNQKKSEQMAKQGI